MQACKDCSFAYKTEPRGPRVIGQTATLECHRYPPTVTAIVAPGAGGPQLVGTISVFPSVTHGCGEYSAKFALVKDTRQ